MIVRQATITDLDQLVPLFDGYRQFYAQPSDVGGARAFLAERLEQQQSVIFMACNEAGQILGFTQLYPSFTSAGMKRIFILNDLYVVPEGRRQGVGTALLEAAVDFGCSVGAGALRLSTARDNHTAQVTYEAASWTRDEVFCTYNRPLG